MPKFIWPLTRVFVDFMLDVPDKKKHPNFYHWYYFVNSFNNGLMNFWLANSKKGEKKEEKVEKK